MRVILYSFANDVTTVSFPDLLPEPEVVDSIIVALKKYSAEWTPEEIDETNKEWTAGNIRTKPPNTPQGEKGEGYIYVAAWNGFYKIGRTKNPPEARIKQLNQGVPDGAVKLVVGAKVPNYVYIEQLLLHRFAHKNSKGEWFNLDDADVEFIRQQLETK